MGKVTISNPEELGEVLTSQEERLGNLETKEPDTAPVEELKVAQEEQKTVIEQLADKVKTLTLALKARGSWKETSQEGKDFGLGEFVQAMLARSQKSIINRGGIPVRNSATNGWDIPEQHKDAHRKLNRDYFLHGGKVPYGVNGKEAEVEYEKTGLASTVMTGDDSGTYYGSYLVPVEYRAELRRVAADSSAMMGLTTVVPMQGITAYVPTTTDALGFTAQGSQDTDATIDTLTVGRSTLTAINYYSYIAITEEYDQDSLVALGALIRGMYGEAWGTKYDSLCLEDSTYGAMSTSGINELVMASGSPAFSDLQPEDLINLIAELDSNNKRRGARFFFHPTVFDHVRKFKDAQGNYIWQQPAGGQPGSIWGYPYSTTDGMPGNADTAASTSFVAFGNPQYIINGERLGFEFRIFDQTQSTMEAGQVFLRCRLRQAFVTAIPSAWAKLTTASS